MVLRSVSLLCCLVLPGAAPDSWLPFCNQRVVSASGRRYVVIEKAGAGIRFDLCERRPGAPPMTPATASPSAQRQGAIDRDPADRLVASGKVAQEPLGVLVPDSFDGFFLFEKYGNVGYGTSATWIDGQGRPTFGLSLVQLFGAVPKAATFSVSSIWWNEGYWIDEASRSVVVVAVGDEVREIAIADGEVTTPDAARLLQCAAKGSAAGRALALEVLSRRSSDDLKHAAPVAMAIFHGKAEPLLLRLRAAVLLGKAGTPVACEDLFAAARAEGQPEDVRTYAVRHLPDVLATKAIPVLRDLMRGKAGPLWGDCYHAFIALGEPAVPTLIAMVGEAAETPDYRGGAAHALAAIRSPAALPVLVDAARTADSYTANAAINAAIATGGEELAKLLIAILQDGSTQDARIALWLRDHPTKAALPALEAALRRATDATERKWMEEARAACGG